MNLNLGCGYCKLDGFVNIDANVDVGPDLVLDFAERGLPYEDESIDKVYCIHAIEHIRRESHEFIFGEINRVLVTGGFILIAFPNAEVCVENYQKNHLGMRLYWEKTICGRGDNLWDCHRSLMNPKDFTIFLSELGFGKFKVVEEVGQSQNSVVEARKIFPVVERTNLLRREVVEK